MTKKKQKPTSWRAIGVDKPGYNRRVNADWQKQVALMPVDDPRDLTSRLMGDPVPDKRAPWRGGGRART